MNNVEPNLQHPVKEEIGLEEYKPSNIQCLREYEVSLRFFNRGCLVRVGCQEIAFEKIEDAMKELNEYITNTYDTQQKWRKILD